MSDLNTYYDLPVLKTPVWKPYIPVYYFAGGTAGAALALGAAAQLRGGRRLKGLIRRAHWVGIAGSSAGAALLILDLGRPERFMNMLRVFRPTSPMNMGAWLLAAAPPAAFAAGTFEPAGYVAGILGLGLCTYTGVLVANSAIPVWQESRRVLPVLFGASAMSAAGSFLDAIEENGSGHGHAIARNYAIAGAAAELAASFVMERHVSAVPRVGLPLKTGLSGTLWRSAAILTAAGLVAAMAPRPNRRTRAAAAVCASLGSLALRFAVHYAGERSARDPRASFQGQRARIAGQDLDVTRHRG